jgi:hypothetical protein
MSLDGVVVDLRYLNAVLTGNYIDSNADGIPSVGDAILYNCTVTNQSNCNITNVSTLGGNLTLGGPISSLMPGVTDSTTFFNSYTLTQNDINVGYVSKYTTIKGTAGGISNYTNVAVSKINYFNLTDGVKLVAFIDTNGNGIQDSGEANLLMRLIMTEPYIILQLIILVICMKPIMLILMILDLVSIQITPIITALQHLQ